MSFYKGDAPPNPYEGKKMYGNKTRARSRSRARSSSGGGVKKLAGRTLRSYMQATGKLADFIGSKLPETKRPSTRRRRR